VISSFGCIIIVSPNFIGVGIRKLVLYLNQILVYFPKIPKSFMSYGFSKIFQNIVQLVV
jgi:hypothetical protein